MPHTDLTFFTNEAQKNLKAKLLDTILNAEHTHAKAHGTLALEREIDQMVYQLYGLNEEKVRIVEGENHTKNANQ